MSVISIRPATERLRNLGDTRRPDRMPNIPPAGALVADRSIVPSAVGRLAQAVQRGGAQVFAAAAAWNREDVDRRLAAAGAEYQRDLQKGFLEGREGTTALLSRNGDAVVGDGLEQLEQDRKRLFSESFENACRNHKLTGELKERFRLHVAPVDLSWNGRMDAHLLAERRRNEVAAVDSLVEEDERTWPNDMFDAAMTKKLLDDYDHKLAVRGATSDVRTAKVRAYALGLAADIARSSFDGLDSEEAFDEKTRLMQEDPDGMYNDNAELYGRLGPGALPQKTVDLLVDEAKARKDAFVREQTRTIGAEVDALISRGGEAESLGLVDEMDAQIKALRQKGQSLKEGSKVRLAAFQAAARLDKSADTLAEQKVVADYLEDLESDPGTTKMRKYPEGTRMARMRDKVRKDIDKERAKRSQAEVAANQDSLSRSLSQLEVLELEGSVSQEERSLVQAAIWTKFRKCVIAGTVGEDFMRTFRSRISTRLSEQERDAMRKFYRAFGYAPNLQSGGEVGAADRNAARRDSNNYYAPYEEEGRRVESGATRVKATQLLEYGDELLKTLRAKGPDIDRKAEVDKEIARLKSEWIKDDVKRNIQATADAVQKSTIAFRGLMDGLLGDDEQGRRDAKTPSYGLRNDGK